MYIKYFKLLSDYKGLKAGLELKTNNKNILVLTGKNGNGKSIILEVLQVCLYKALINTSYNHFNLFIPHFELHVTVNEKNYNFIWSLDSFEVQSSLPFTTNIISLTSGINEQLSSFPNYSTLNEITFTRANMVAGYAPDFSNQRNIYVSKRKSKIYFLINSIFNFDEMKNFLVSKNIDEMHFKKLTNFSINVNVPTYRKWNPIRNAYDILFLTLPLIVKETLDRLYCTHTKFDLYSFRLSYS